MTLSETERASSNDKVVHLAVVSSSGNGPGRATHRRASYDARIRNLTIEVRHGEVPQLAVRVLNRLARSGALTKKVNISHRNGRMARDIRHDVMASWPEGRDSITMLPTTVADADVNACASAA